MSNPILSRRSVMTGIAAALILPQTALAFSNGQAESLIRSAVKDINAIINSGQSESAMYRSFETVLRKYADTPAIARSVLGPPARSASSAQLSAFTAAFEKYLSRKYGSRFREFIGSEIVVQNSQKVNSIYDVRCSVKLRGESPFDISFIVSDRSGRFIDLMIEGVSLLKSERAEIGSMLDRAGGNIDALTAQLR